MPVGDEMQARSLLDGAAFAMADAADLCRWFVPALLLAVLFGVFIFLLGYLLDDLPLDLEIPRAPAAIFRWCRETWGPRKEAHRKDAPVV